MNDRAHGLDNSNMRRRALLAWLRMLRIVRRAERAAAQQLRAYDLSYAQFDVVAQLGVAEGMSQQALAERLLVTQGNITQLLDKMEQRGLVRRQRAGRTNALFLTDAGQRLFAQAVPAHERWQVARLAALTDEEQAQLLRLLTKLDQAQRREQ